MTASVWRKSSYCGEAGCVEIASTDGTVLVRDSKLDDSPILRFTPEAWTAFTSAVRAGEMEIPC